MAYAPAPSVKGTSQGHFFNKLGFKSMDATEEVRRTFTTDMANHVQHSSHKFLLRSANPKAFETVVSEFLAEYGPVYWGTSMRDHLEQPDILKGFLCPRDSLRTNSR